MPYIDVVSVKIALFVDGALTIVSLNIPKEFTYENRIRSAYILRNLNICTCGRIPVHSCAVCPGSRCVVCKKYGHIVGFCSGDIKQSVPLPDSMIWRR